MLVFLRPPPHPTCTPDSYLYTTSFSQKDTDTGHTAEFLKSLKGPQTSDKQQVAIGCPVPLAKWPQEWNK